MPAFGPRPGRREADRLARRGPVRASARRRRTPQRRGGVGVARDIAAAVSRAGTATVAGRFQRHVSLRQEPLRGSRSGGRWGPEGAYPVLYLGRPTDSVIVEAYRHLVETVERMQPHMVGPRHLVTCEVEITSVLDLREAASRDAAGLTIADLCSEVGRLRNMSPHRRGRARARPARRHRLGRRWPRRDPGDIRRSPIRGRAADADRRAGLGVASSRPADREHVGPRAPGQGAQA